MNKLSKLLSAFILVATMVTIGACKKTYDAPPGPTDPNIEANLTIAQLKAYHTIKGAYDLIDQDIIVSGIVVANDKSGNFYKQLFIQDTTGAIQLLVDANSLYTSYPVGRRVYIKAKGLTLSDFSGTMELGVKANINGLPSLEGIPSSLLSNYLIGGSINNPVEPILVTLGQLGNRLDDRYINALVKLEGFEFVDGELNRTYSDTSVYKATTNLHIKDCNPNPNELTVRTSAYANFAGVPVPKGNGDITFIYTVFINASGSQTTQQLIIRDTNDVNFNNLRCDGSTGTGELPPGTLLFENFSSQNIDNIHPVIIEGWQNLTEAGNITWDARTFGSQIYAQASAFNSNLPSVISWLITPALNLTGTTKNLSFDTKQGFTGAPGSTTIADFKVLISTNYTGTGNPWAAGVTWTDLTSQATLSPGTVTSFPSNYTNSGLINLNAYSGNVYIAFKYIGADPTGTANDKTSTWQLDNIKVTAN